MTRQSIRLLACSPLLLLLGLWGCATPRSAGQPPQQRAIPAPSAAAEQPSATTQPTTASSQPAAAASRPAASQPATSQPAVPRAVTAAREPVDIPLRDHARVDKWADKFGGPRAQLFPQWLERYSRYAPLIRPMLKEAGLPQDTIYLAMIESGFSCRAYSRARAAGPWQFIEATGSRYGLKRDFWVDERRDPVKATDAAIRHLNDLHNEFGDWYLAWAAYNAGPGKVRTAIRRYKTRDFFELIEKPYLRPETKDYVPKIIAAAKVAKDPNTLHYRYIVPMEPWAHDTIEVVDATDLGLIAEVCGSRVEELADLNPELRRWATPPVQKGAAPYQLRVPDGTGTRCQTALDAVPAAKRLTFRHHQVRSGETPGGIASRYGISVKTLMSMNKIRSAHSLRAGTDLLIPIPSRVPPNVLAREWAATQPYRRPATSQPRPATTRPAIAVQSVSRPSAPSKRGHEAPAGTEASSYKVQRGDNLWTIAKKHGVSVVQLKQWNHFKRAPTLQPGQTLVLYLRTDRTD